MLEGFHVSDARNQCICNLGLLFHAGHYNIWLHSSCPRTKSRTLGGESRTGQFDYLTCYFNWHRVQWLQQLNRSTACQAYCILHTPSLICGSRSGMIAVAILLSHLWRRPASFHPCACFSFLHTNSVPQVPHTHIMLFLTHFTHLPYPWARFSSSRTDLVPEVPHMHLFLNYFTWLPYPLASLSFSHTSSTLGSSSCAYYVVVSHSMHITPYSCATFPSRPPIK